MTYILAVTTLLFLLPLCAAVTYYYVLLLVCLFTGGEDEPLVSPDGLYRYIILIPAYNEERCIEQTIRSCQEIDYPQDLYEIVVIADNCSDGTGEIARNCGVKVLERYDDTKRGKGYALEFAFNLLRDKGCDAYFIVDADCEVSPSVFMLASGFYAKGERVIQFDNSVSNPDESAMTYALAVGNFIENRLFYTPKSLLNLAVFLRGTGMLIAKSILDVYPWDAHTVGEDAEYSITLLRNGVRVRFIHTAGVRSPFPVEKEQLDVQRTRWAAGSLGYGRKEAMALVVNGLRTKNWMLVDAGMTFFLLSKPLLLLFSMISLGGALLCFLCEAQLSALLYAAFLCFSLLVLYFACAIVAFGVTWRRLGLLFQVPGILLRLIAITVSGAVGRPEAIWRKTPR